jgi:hypothetical protein
MEITFSRTTHYSLVLDAKDRKALAKHLDMPTRKFNKLVNDGELLDDHWDEVIGWLNQQTTQPDIIDEDPIDDMAVHV